MDRSSSSRIDSSELAVIVVIDSSLKTAESCASHLYDQYLIPILSRLRSDSGANRFSLAQVTYGRTPQTPNASEGPVILSRQPFLAENQTQVLGMMKNRPYDLGIGTTPNRSESGMAVLEGMMTALEVCLFHSVTFLAR